MRLPKYSLGIGDRFGHQGAAQVDALMAVHERGVPVAPVWNKSYREHTIVGSSPAEVRREADHAVAVRGWTGPYFVDADHIGLKVVDGFIEASDYFTIDVADFIGVRAGDDDLSRFVEKHQGRIRRVQIPGIEEQLDISRQTLAEAAGKFLLAVQEAGRIYRHIENRKGRGAFVTEVSLDETGQPQTPLEMLLILAALADEGIPAQTIAPRFSGRFNKGVDYVGDVGQFAREFQQDLAVIAFAVREFGLPQGLKLSIHSGSDKFSLYGPIHQALASFDAGVHLKTAGTTWLEELTGLALAGGDGLKIAKEVYGTARLRLEELSAPYASVIDIDAAALPAADTVDRLSGEAFAAMLRHDQSCAAYNRSFRQLLHVGYKVAAEMGDRFVAALETHADVVAQNVTENLYRRHIRPLFLGE